MTQTQQARLLIIDVDGTLLTDDQQITPATCTAIQQAAARGVQIALASARGPSALRGIMRVLGIDGLTICYTGALNCRLSADPLVPTETVTECRMSLASAHTILRNALEMGISIGWFIGDYWYIPRWDLRLRRESTITGVTPIVAPVATLSHPPHKLQCIVGERELLPLLSTLMKALPQDCAGHFSHANYLEITHQGVDKATALLALGRQLGIPPAATVAIGDQENDIAMLGLAALGIAMGNAPPAVKAIADWITDTNNRDGVAQAIHRLSVTGWL